VVRVGRAFGWLWAAYTVSAVGTWLAFDAFSLVAILVLHSGPTAVAALSSAGLAAGAVCAVPLGPWVEGRRKRPVMIAADLVRCAALLTVPAAYALHALTFGQLLAVSVLVAAADIAFKSASGAHLKTLVPPEHLLTANGRFESTSWTTTALGPPLGGAAIALFGPVMTVLANAVSFLLSALGIRAIRGAEPVSDAPRTARPSLRDLTEGWRYILRHPALRPLFFNTVLVNGLIMAAAPPLAVLMLGPLGFPPWQYGLAFGAPCLGGLLGSRLSGRLVAAMGRDRVLYVFGRLRSVWPLGLAFVRPGVAGLAVVITVELCLITCMGVFNPVYATYRLEQTAGDRVSRVLSSWQVSSSLSIAGTTALWGVLAGLAGPRTAIAAAGVLLLATPLLITRRRPSSPAATPVRTPAAGSAGR
jgi:MFS family permease